MMSSTTTKLSRVLVVAIGIMSFTIEAAATFCPSTYQPTSYAPISIECPKDVQWIRPPTRLNLKEAEWVRGRKRVVADALNTYLEHLCLEDFDNSRYIRALRRSDYAHVPTLGLAISGGGYRSGYTGTGAIRALDSRLEASNEQHVGGLLQSLTYLSGLSGGSWPVVSLTSHNFPTVDEIVQIWLSQPNGSSNSSSPGSPDSIFEDIAAKLKAGFNVSTSDYLGRNSAYEFLSGPHGGVNNTWSGIARLSNFVNHQMPLPILQASELTDDDKEYFALKVPYYNATSYEMTPFEIGSWTKGFTPTEWMGTRLDDGVPVNGSICTLGFDSSSFMMGTATSAVNFWIIENDSNGVLAPFPKRSINSLKRITPLSQRDLSLFPNATLNGLLEGFKNIFGLSAAQVDHAIWPNPFASSSSGIPRDLSLVDSSEAGQVIPLWSQIQPARASSFIIAWDDNPDAEPYAWLNGTSIHNMYLAAKASGLPFPIVPPPRTMLNKNFTMRPTFFGCNANLTTTGTTQSPIVLYMANAPYSAYTNYTWTQSIFSNAQMYEIFDNSFNAFTQGNGTLDHEWPACLGCAVVEGSLEKLGMRRTKQCERCFKKHCWDGIYDEREPGILNPGLPLAPGLSFAEWNATIWN